MTLLDQSSSLPKIDEIARAQVLDLVEISQPVTPDGYYITPDHPLLSLASLQTYSDLYFSRFNAAYPLIHQATFEASQCETLLLTSILLLGATYCEKDAHQLARTPRALGASNHPLGGMFWQVQSGAEAARYEPSLSRPADQPHQA
ncbi:hypothetical protein M8818_000189 [Zalaria obscura]|uniref:Uncharacterized protein n=1 Tax=Zalaria obscura TaxID=2024903 RepID=A0ACC3SNW2_9PEZI